MNKVKLINVDQANPNIKLSIMRNIIGHDAARIMSTLTASPHAADQYEGMLSDLEKYVNPGKNNFFGRYMFSSRQQKKEKALTIF